MAEINPASSNLIENNNVNFKNPTPVIEIYPRAYGQKDEYVPSAQNENETPKKKGFWGSFLKYMAISAAIIFAGRKGLFGKKIQAWFGGATKIKPEQVFERIETKMSEFLGKGGQTVKTSKITTASDGTSILRAEFENGTVREYAIKEGENVIKLFGKKGEGIEEYILFDKMDGAVKYRTDLARSADGKVRAYASYKGEDVLNADFNEVTGIFKDYWRKDPQRQFGILGRYKGDSQVRTFTNPTGDKPYTLDIKKIYKDGKLSKIKHQSGTELKTFIYDESGNLTKITSKPID